MTTAVSTVEQRLQRLEDTEAIRTLTARYAHAVDRGWMGKSVDAATLATVFAADATWVAATFSMQAKGREDIVAMLSNPEGAAPFAVHSFTNPVIEVDDNTARATWLLWVATEFAAGQSMQEVFQSEDLTYVRTAEGWVIQAIDLHFGKMLNN